MNKKAKILITLTIIILLTTILFSVIFVPFVIDSVQPTNQPSSQTTSSFVPNSNPTPITEQTDRNANKLYKLFYVPIDEGESLKMSEMVLYEDGIIYLDEMFDNGQILRRTYQISQNDITQIDGIYTSIKTQKSVSGKCNEGKTFVIYNYKDNAEYRSCNNCSIDISYAFEQMQKIMIK